MTRTGLLEIFFDFFGSSDNMQYLSMIESLELCTDFT